MGYSSSPIFCFRHVAHGEVVIVRSNSLKNVCPLEEFPAGKKKIIIEPHTSHHLDRRQFKQTVNLARVPIFIK